MSTTALTEEAKHIRQLCVKTSADTNSSHLGCALSMTDLITYLYFEKMDLKNDTFILSKGHAVLGLYAALKQKGIISLADYESFNKNDTYLLGHPNHLVNGISVSTGSLGHGPAIAAGLAWSNDMKNRPGTVYCLLGDGECQEGTVWEALIFISRSLFKKIILIIDANKYQGFTDPSNAIFSEDKLLSMLKGTGLDVVEIDGHNFENMRTAFEKRLNRPRIIFAHTIKGKGVSFMENRFEWHYKTPDSEQLAKALEELK